MYAITFALIVASIWSLSGCGLTGEPGGRDAGGRDPSPASDRVIRIGTSGDYAPFSVWETGGAPRGFSIAIAERFVAETGGAIEWVRFRWPDLASDLTAGRFDIALSGITIRSDRSIGGRFSVPLTTSGALVLVPVESSIESAADLDRASVAIAVNAGGHLERVARRLFPRARIEAVPDNTRVLERLDETGVEAVDAVVTDSLEAPIWMRESKASKRALRAIGPLTRDAKAAWFPASRASLARDFDEWLLRAEATGELAALRQRFDLAPDRTAKPGAALLASLGERLALMPAVAEAKAILGVPVENLAREKVVLDSAVASIEDAASAVGAEPPEPAAVMRFFGAQIEAAKTIQTERLQRGAGVAKATASETERGAARHRLDDSIRPALLYLGDRIARLLVAATRDPGPGPTFADVAKALESLDLPGSQIRAIHAALDGLLSRE